MKLSGKELEDFDADALSADERRRLRRILEDDERARWLWGTLHRVVIAVGAVAAALTALKVFFGAYFLSGK